MRKTKMNMKSHDKDAKLDKTRKYRTRTNKKNRNRISRSNKSKSKSKDKIKIPTKIKGGNNPFSGISGIFGTMSYNISNAMSTFTITPPSSPINPTEHPMNPSPGKQNL